MIDPLAGGGFVAFQVPGAEPLDPGHGCSAAPLATYEMEVCQEGAGGRRLATGSLSTFIVEGYEGYLEQA